MSQTAHAKSGERASASKILALLGL